MPDSVLTQPSSTSLLQPSKFQLSFKRLPDVQYFCQKADIPSVSLNALEQPTPFKNKPVAGNKITYETLDIEFLLEETMNSWKEIYTWMTDLGLLTGYQDYRNLGTLANNIKSQFKTKADQYSDATLTVLSTQNNPKLRFQFFDCFPVHLGRVSFDTTASPDQVTMTCTASFAMFYYSMVPVT